jgi:endonuclease/exonuclease/phosphatase family metal-dependent hydrolase
VAFWRGRRSLEGTSVCYRDAWESARPGEAGHTFTLTNPLVAENKRAFDRGRRIDYVFVRCGDSLHGPTLDVRARIRAFAESVGGVWVSDHFGFVAELSVPDVCS